MIADTLAGPRRRVRAAAEPCPPGQGLDAVVSLLSSATPAARRRLLGVLLRAAAEGI
ncbi:MAG: hypothetical protein JSR86_21295 [Proteobacteria bacterium]|nr:hypothetical protein [Pseudomonadota bacterium]